VLAACLFPATYRYSILVGWLLQAAVIHARINLPACEGCSAEPQDMTKASKIYSA